MFQKAKLDLPCTSNYLCSIYTVLGIMSNFRDDLKGLCRYYEYVLLF